MAEMEFAPHQKSLTTIATIFINQEHRKTKSGLRTDPFPSGPCSMDRRPGPFSLHSWPTLFRDIPAGPACEVHAGSNSAASSDAIAARRQLTCTRTIDTSRSACTVMWTGRNFSITAMLVVRCGDAVTAVKLPAPASAIGSTS